MGWYTVNKKRERRLGKSRKNIKKATDRWRFIRSYR